MHTDWHNAIDANDLLSGIGDERRLRGARMTLERAEKGSCQGSDERRGQLAGGATRLQFSAKAEGSGMDRPRRCYWIPTISDPLQLACALALRLKDADRAIEVLELISSG